MKLTKFQHACFTVEKEGKTLIVDPGNISHDFIIPHHISGIIVTHQHADHFDETRVQALLTKNPSLVIIGHETIVGRYSDNSTIVAKLGETYTVDGFSLQFFGGAHADITTTVTPPPNLGVLIDNRLYYPGDSFALPNIDVTIKELALPISAPWLKVSEAMDFLAKANPSFVFPTHDGILSEDGKAIYDRLFGTAASGQKITYKRLDNASVELE